MTLVGEALGETGETGHKYNESNQFHVNFYVFEATLACGTRLCGKVKVHKVDLGWIVESWVYVGRAVRDNNNRIDEVVYIGFVVLPSPTIR